MITIQRLPLFRLLALSSTMTTTSVSVSARFVSVLLQSLNQEMMIDGK